MTKRKDLPLKHICVATSPLLVESLPENFNTLTNAPVRTVNGSFSMLSTVEDAYDVLRVSSYSQRGALNTPQAKPTQSHQRQHGLQHTLDGTDPVAALGW